MNWLSFFIGALVGWGIEWIIDVLFWRRRHQGSASEARLRVEMADMESECSQLKAQLAGCQEERAEFSKQVSTQADASRTCDLSLERAHAQVSALEQQVVDLQSTLSATEVRASDTHIDLTDMAENVSQFASPPVVIPVEPDDLSKIEGIGPKISELLIKNGIRTFAELAAADVAHLKAILADAGSRYRLADPSTWPNQARFAATEDWDALEVLQRDLKGGRYTPV